MKKRFFILLLIAVHFVLFLLVGTENAKARSTVRQDSLEITITVPIEMRGLLDMRWRSEKDGQWYQGRDLADLLEAEIERSWNQGLSPWRYRGCYRLQLDVQIKALAKDAPFSGASHRIDVVNAPSVRKGSLGFVDTPDRPDKHTDVDTPYKRSLTGMWGRTPILVYTHEVGHLLGLSDDYDRIENEDGTVSFPALLGREGTLMARGPKIDQALTDRIGDQLAKTMDLPGCIYARYETRTDGTQYNRRHGLDNPSIVQGFVIVEVFAVDDGLGNLEGEGTYTQFFTEEFQFAGIQGLCRERSQYWSDSEVQSFRVRGSRTEQDWIELFIPLQDLIAKRKSELLIGDQVDCYFNTNDVVPETSVSSNKAPGVIQVMLQNGKHEWSWTGGDTNETQTYIIVEEREMGK